MSKPPILVLAPPASGKTTALRYLKPELAKRTLYVNCDDKSLPWVGKTDIKLYDAGCPTLIPNILDSAGKSGKFDLIVIDTITLAMQEYARKFLNTTAPKYSTDASGNVISNPDYIALDRTGSKIDGMSGWGRYGTLVCDIIAAAKKTGVQVVIFGHLSSVADDSGNYKFRCPLQGAIGKQGIEGLFDVVMHAQQMKLKDLSKEGQDHQWLGTTESRKGTEARYVYQVDHTKNTAGTHDIRSPDGLWPEDVQFIDNNLQMVFDRFEEVYGE